MPFQFALLNESEVHQAYNTSACSMRRFLPIDGYSGIGGGFKPAVCLKGLEPFLDPLKEVFASAFGLYFLLPIGVDDVQKTVWIALEFIP